MKIMNFQITSIVAFLLGLFSGITECRPADGMDALAQIFPMKTYHHELPSAGRMIPVKVVHFKNIAISPTPASSFVQDTPRQPRDSQSMYPMVPRGFKDDFDIKPNRRSQLEIKFEMQVPIIPQNISTPKWVPGELIVSGITRRQVKMIDQSQFGPLRSVTFIPSVQAGIVVFEKRYNPEKLALALKYLYGIESEPNGVINTSS